MTSSSPALSSSQSSNLLQILRRANAHYSRIAFIIRASIHPTHHARKRAAALRLTISIQMALKLDPKQISTIPLPVLDTVVTPIHLRKAVVSHERDLSPASRPLLKCTTPTHPQTGALVSPLSLDSCVLLTPGSPFKAQRVQSLTSRWSMTPIDANSDAAQGLPEGIAITYDPDYDQDMVLCSPTEGGESVRFTLEPPVQPNHFPRANDSRQFTRHSDIPLAVTKPLSWNSDISSPGSLSTESTSTTSSHGPVTPHSPDGAQKLTVRIKRKSPELDDDALEKPPKYGRKEWTISHRKIVQRTIPLRSGRF